MDHLSCAIAEHRKKFYSAFMNVSDYVKGDELNYNPKAGSKILSYHKWKEMVDNLEAYNELMEVNDHPGLVRFARENKKIYHLKARFTVGNRNDGTKYLFAVGETLQKGSQRVLGYNPLLEVVHMGNLFDVCQRIHYKESCHSKTEWMFNYTKKQYHNITRSIIRKFVDACPICWNNDHLKKKKHIGAKVPIPSASFRDRFQFDLIDMGKQEATESMNHYGVVMKWILHTKDHFTRYSHVVAIKSKEAKIIAFELNQLFSLISFQLYYIVKTRNLWLTQGK